MDERVLAERSGAWIRKQTDRWGVTTETLANESGVAPDRIDALALGTDYPSPVEVSLICRAINRHRTTPSADDSGFRRELAESAGYTIEDEMVKTPGDHPFVERRQQSGYGGSDG